MKIIFFIFATLTLVLGDQAQIDEFAAGSRLFSQDLYNVLQADNAGNFLISPFSAETVFALTQSGAFGATGEEIRNALHLPATKEEVEGEVKSVLPAIHSEFVELATANKVYVEDNFSIRDEFKSVVTGVYQAEFQNVEFAQSEEAAGVINKWVEEHTAGKIHELVKADDFDATTKIVLVNALYFKGNWTVPFDPKETNKTVFYTSVDTTVDSLMMYKPSEYYNYYESPELDAKLLEIPFLGEEATMTIVLPNEKEGIVNLEKQMDRVLATPQYTREWVEVQLPKFKIETTIDFKEVLMKLGVVEAFGGGADFSGIAGDPGELFIAQARQKTFIDVNEIGVEAAAATEVGGSDSVPPPADRFFVADHPFVFFLKVRDIVLFHGRVLVPEYETSD